MHSANPTVDGDLSPPPALKLHLERHSSEQLVDMESGVSPKYTKRLSQAITSGDMDLCKKEFSAPMSQEMSTEKDQRSPLTIAIISGQTRIAKWLVLEKQAVVDSKDADGATPLHWAIIQGDEEMAHWLAEECGADMEETDFKGNGCLHYAACCGREELFRWGVEKGLSMTALNRDDKTCYWWAKKNKKHAILELIETLDAYALGLRSLNNDNFSTPCNLPSQ